MKRLCVVLFVVSFCPLLLAGPGFAQSSAVRVTEAFARVSQDGRTAAAFMNIQGGPDRLVGVASDAADLVELRETVRTEGVVSTRPVAGVLITPGVATRLTPSGQHIVLSNLKRPLRDGDGLSLVLTFARAGKVTVPVPVARVAEPPRPNVAVPGLAGPRR